MTVPANTVLSPTGAVKIIECADPGGGTAGLPTSDNDCDPAETIQGSTIIPGATGGFTYKNYQVTDLPNPNLAPTSPIDCGAAPNPCVLYIGDDYTNFSGAGYFLSQPFYVVDKDGNGDGADPGDGSAPPAATVPSASLSTVAASPTTVVADGANSSTVTVTLNGVNSESQTVPIASAPVTLTANSGTHSRSPPHPPPPMH